MQIVSGPRIIDTCRANSRRRKNTNQLRKYRTGRNGICFLEHDLSVILQFYNVHNFSCYRLGFLVLKEVVSIQSIQFNSLYLAIKIIIPITK